jgi:hypothetical protein
MAAVRDTCQGNYAFYNDGLNGTSRDYENGDIGVSDLYYRVIGDFRHKFMNKRA